MVHVLRRLSPGIAAAAVIAGLAVPMSTASGGSTTAPDVPSRFSFAATDLDPVRSGIWQDVRRVPGEFQHIDGWVSAVGAAAAFSDADRDGLHNDICLVDPRADTVTVQPAPETGSRYAPFELRPPASLGYQPVEMAPTGCLPTDLNEDGLGDFLVYYWGRSPVLFLATGPGSPGAAAFRAQDLVGRPENWATETALTSDLDGDGHLDIVVGNYFPDDVDLLGDRGSSAVDAAEAMPSSMSRASNGGRNRILRVTRSIGADAAGGPAVAVEDVSTVLTPEQAHAWTLAIGAQDLNGDLLPELYVANDFGADHLLLNVSRPGTVAFRSVSGPRRAATPHSQVLGRDSFKGMGVDFGDLDGDRRTDIFVSNLTAPRGLMETHMAWIRTGTDADLYRGTAPFTDRAEALGLANTGWAWDAKFGDFDNDGSSEIVQTTGFLRGTRRSGWPQLQELGTAQDGRLADVRNWPDFSFGVDVSGHERDAFFTRRADGRWADVAAQAGLDSDVPSRGVATADVDGDGRLDAVVAKQWAASTFLRNRSRSGHRAITVNLMLRNDPDDLSRPSASAGPVVHADASPAVGATVTLDDGRTQQVDGGNGHASVRAPQLHFGAGEARGSTATVRWRDRRGATHSWRTRLDVGVTTVVLGTGG